MQIAVGFEFTVTGVFGIIVKLVVAVVVPHSLVTLAVTMWLPVAANEIFVGAALVDVAGVPPPKVQE